MCTAETSVPLPGAIPRACGIVQSVLVAIQGMPPSSSGSFERVRGLGQLRPADLGGEALHDGGRRVVGAAGDDEARLLDLAHEPLAADDEHGRAGGDALDEQAHGRLRARDDLVRRGRRAPARSDAPATEASVREALFVM